MKTSSCKAKGRRCAQWVKDIILKNLYETTEAVTKSRDVLVTPSGVNGPDINLSFWAFTFYPFKIECKNVEKVSIWAAYDQCCGHEGNGEPLLVIQRNRTKPLAVIDAEYFFTKMRIIK